MITSHTRDEVKQAVAQGELNIRALDHYDICKERRSGKKITDLARDFNMSERHIKRIIACKCPSDE